MDSVIRKLPGISLAAIIVVPAWILGQQFPVIGSPVLGILSGTLLAFRKRPAAFRSGITYTSKKLLQYSIILLGFDTDLFQIFKVGSQTLLLMAFTLTATFLGAYLIGKALKVDRDTNILIGVDTAICGGSAIAATAPVIGAKDESVMRFTSTIFFFNVIAAFLFPFLGHTMQMSSFHFGLWAGTAINDTSSVVTVGYTFNDAAGNLAVIVKLTRTLMIIPITLVLTFYIAKRQSRTGNVNYSFAKIFPWFVLGFIAAAIINTFIPLPAGMGKALATFGKSMIVMAMAAIGLNTNLADLVKHGWRPIVPDLSCWAILAVTSLAMQYSLLSYLL